MTASTDKTNLLGMPQSALESYFASIGEKPFRARQVMQWIYQRGVSDLGAMTDLSLKLREILDKE